MGLLLLRTLGLVVLFEVLGGALLVTAPRRRLPVALGLLALIAALGASQRSLDPALFLGSAVLAGTLVGWAVRRGRGVWASVALGMLPVLVAGTVELAGSDPRRNWAELRAQVEQVAGIQAESPAPDTSPEGQRLAERSEFMARLATTWVLRLLPMELAGMALLQVLPLVGFAGAWMRRLGLPVAVPPVRRWEVPFAAIWALALGLALIALRQRIAVVAGANIAAFAGLLFAVQGFAVGLAFFGRGRAPLVRGLLLLVAALLAWPFFVSGLALLGALDSWVDFRRLRRATDES
jgi:hypothetical protein